MNDNVLEAILVTNTYVVSKYFQGKDGYYVRVEAVLPIAEEVRDPRENCEPRKVCY